MWGVNNVQMTVTGFIRKLMGRREGSGVQKTEYSPLTKIWIFADF